MQSFRRHPLRSLRGPLSAVRRPMRPRLSLQVVILLFAAGGGDLSAQAQLQAQTSPAPPPAVIEEGTLQFVDLGTCPSLSGEEVQGCRLGYRTRGRAFLQEEGSPAPSS